MALFPWALVTLSELKQFIPVNDTGKDASLERAIERATRVIEGYVDRRLVYRAPPEVDGSANIVANVALTNATLTIANQPSSAGRTLIYTVTDPDRSVTAGIITVTGTVAGVAGTTEVIDVTNGTTQHGTKFFTAITSIVTTLFAGNGASDFIKVGSSVGMVEYHTLNRSIRGISDLRLLETPVRQVNAVYEDLTNTYPETTLLTATTQYSVGVSNGKITRLSMSRPWSWYPQWRAVKVIYSAGYAGAANVPSDIKYECNRLAALMYQEAERKQIGVSQISDAGQSMTRFAPASLSESAKAALGIYIRPQLFGTTAERDFDLEAA